MNRLRQGLLAATVAALCAGCGSSPGFVVGDTGPASAPARAAASHSAAATRPAGPAPESSSAAAGAGGLGTGTAVSAACVRRVHSWERGAGGRALHRTRPVLRRALLAERARDYPAAAADLNRLAGYAPVLAQRPLPACAGRRPYWQRLAGSVQGAVSLVGQVEAASLPAVAQATSDTAQARSSARLLVRQLRGEGL